MQVLRASKFLHDWQRVSFDQSLDRVLWTLLQLGTILRPCSLEPSYSKNLPSSVYDHPRYLIRFSSSSTVLPRWCWITLAGLPQESCYVNLTGVFSNLWCFFLVISFPLTPPCSLAMRFYLPTLYAEVSWFYTKDFFSFFNSYWIKSAFSALLSNFDFL